MSTPLPSVKLSPKQPPVENADSKANNVISGHYSLKNRRLQLRTMIRTGYRKSLEALLGPPGSYNNNNNNRGAGGKKKNKRKKKINNKPQVQHGATNTDTTLLLSLSPEKKRKTTPTNDMMSSSREIIEEVVNMKNEFDVSTSDNEEKNCRKRYSGDNTVANVANVDTATAAATAAATATAFILQQRDTKIENNVHTHESDDKENSGFCCKDLESNPSSDDVDRIDENAVAVNGSRKNKMEHDEDDDDDDEEMSPLLLSLSLADTSPPSLPSKPALKTPLSPLLLSPHSASATATATATDIAPNVETRIDITEIDCKINVPEADDDDDDDDDDDAPFILDDETQQEHSYCDDAKDRGVWEDRGNDPLPFGYFGEDRNGNETTGTICRNKLNHQEQLEDGFVTLSNLVLPKCQSIICTTFTHNDQTVRFLRDHFGGQTGTLPSQVLLLGHGDYQGSSFCTIPSSVSPDDSSSTTTESKSNTNINTNTNITPSLPASNDNHSEWFWMACRPFGNNHHLMHAKLLLFRSQEGLRIVVSGNNLTEHQWTEDRDCLWILDIPVSNTVDLTGESVGQETKSPSFLVTPEGDNDERYSDNDERYSDNEPPLSRLRYFLIDLMKSSPAFHSIEYRLDKEITTFLYERVGVILDGLCDDHPINCNNGINSRGHRCMFRFIFSFPRQFRRGGWQQLAGAVRALRHQDEDAVQHQQLKQGIELTTEASIPNQHDDFFYDTDDGYSDDGRDGKNANVHIEKAMELEESLHMYAMSGSVGDLKPDFLRQMRLAFCGFDLHTGNDNEGHNVKNDKLKKWLIASPNSDWSTIQKTYCLWPSQHIVRMMNPIAVLGRGRPMSWKHWKSIPKAAQRRLFFDAVPSPYKTALVCSTASQIAAGNRGISSNKIIIRMDRGDYKLRAGLLESYYAFTHGKAIVASNMVTRRCTTTKTIYSNKINSIFEKKSCRSDSDGTSPQQYTALYAGSHNFSKKAWGIRRAMPGNVEFGVVIITTDPDQAERWRSRLPYRLPEPGENSNGYRPGRPADVFKFQKKKATTTTTATN